MSRLFVSLVAGSLLASPTAGGAGCELAGFESRAPDHPQCLFFSGTRSYREADYESAFAYWERLRALPSIDPSFESLRVDAYNNLGYLFFKGWGTARDLETAIRYWQQATDLGHHEAPYHLCHLLADPAGPSYRPARALGYCRLSLRRIEARPELKGDFASTLTDLRQIIARLQAR